jgi:hypothetical protein
MVDCRGWQLIGPTGIFVGVVATSAFTGDVAVSPARTMHGLMRPTDN